MSLLNLELKGLREANAELVAENRRLHEKNNHIRHGAKKWKLRAIKAEKQLDNAAAIYTQREADADAHLKWEMDKAKGQLESERLWRMRAEQEATEVKAHAYDLMREKGLR